RLYHAKGTNGKIYVDDILICDAIELPWKGNVPRVSCIPPGLYDLEMYPSSKFGMRLLVKDVLGRSGILLHPANVALFELKGCIAPVTSCIGFGRGINSRIATERVEDLARGAFNRGEKVQLQIIGEVP